MTGVGPHDFLSDGVTDGYTHETGCIRCPLPPGNAIHRVPEQTAEAAEIDARVLGERGDS